MAYQTGTAAWLPMTARLGMVCKAVAGDPRRMLKIIELRESNRGL
jgi:hypothetical protein